MKVFCNIPCEFQWNSTIYLARGFWSCVYKYTYIMNIQKTRKYTLHHFAPFHGQSLIIEQVLFKLRICILFAVSNPFFLVRKVITQKLSYRKDVFRFVILHNRGHFLCRNLLCRQLRLSYVEPYFLLIFLLLY